MVRGQYKRWTAAVHTMLATSNNSSLRVPRAHARRTSRGPFFLEETFPVTPASERFLIAAMGSPTCSR